MMSRARFVLAAALVLGASQAQAQAQTWPARPLEFTVVWCPRLKSRLGPAACNEARGAARSRRAAAQPLRTVTARSGGASRDGRACAGSGARTGWPIIPSPKRPARDRRHNSRERFRLGSSDDRRSFRQCRERVMIRSIATTVAAGLGLLTGTPPTVAAASAEALLAWLYGKVRRLHPASRSGTRAMPEPAALVLNRPTR